MIGYLNISCFELNLLRLRGNYFFILGVCINLLVLDTVNSVSAQKKMQWWNPAHSKIYAIQGQEWHAELEKPYDRLPARLKKKVRKPVWSLSQEAAGLIVRFRTNADEIDIRYTVSRKTYRPHIPQTGVSGVDLYAQDSEGQWEWSSGKYHFGDTISYSYSHLKEGSRDL